MKGKIHGQWIELPRKGFYWRTMFLRVACPMAALSGVFLIIDATYHDREFIAFFNTMITGVNLLLSVHGYRNYRL